MRLLLLTAAIALTAGSATASSIEPISGRKVTANSIVVKSCADCPAPKPRESASVYTVPELEPGTQTIEILDINGQKKTVRTEAWLGGSPVVHISRAQPETPPVATASASEETLPAIALPSEPGTLSVRAAGMSGTGTAADLSGTADGIDLSATTSALPETGTITAASGELDLSDFQLRLN